MNRNRAMLVIMTVGLFAVACAAQSVKRAGVKEQSRFSAEDDTVNRPVDVPEGVLQILRRDERVRLYLEAEEKSPEELTTASFLASQIHLDGVDEVDLIVIGEDRLRGANVVVFWIFRKSPQGYKLILKVAAHDLEVLNTRWKRFRNIRIFSLTAGTISTVVFRFDGKKYQEYQSKLEPIK